MASELDTIKTGFVAKLGFTPRSTNINTQKIDNSLLETYGILSVEFLLQDGLKKIWFSGKTFLLVDTSREVVLGMVFLSFNNANF